MSETSKIEAAHAEAAAQKPSEVAAVARRAWRGIVAIAVAVCVAVVTLGLGAMALLINGYIPLAGLERRISSAIEERLGPNWTVEAEQAELDRLDGRSRLRVRDVSFRHVSGASFRAPEAVLGYEAMALLRGDIRLVSLDLRGVNIRLGVRQDGSLLLEQDAQPEQAPKTPVAGDPVDWDAFAGTMNAIGALVADDGLLGSLESAGIGGARVTLVDPAGRQRSGLDDVDIRLQRFGGGQARLAMKGRIGSRWKELAIDLSSAPDGSRSATVNIQRFEPAEAVALAFGNAMVGLDGLALSGTISLTQSTGGERRIAAGLSVAPGHLTVNNAGLDPIAIQGARLDFASDDALKTVKVGRVALEAGETKLAGSGEAQSENGLWRVTLDSAGQVAGVGRDPAVAISAVRAQFEIDPGANEVRLGQLSIKGPLITAEGSGVARRREDQASHQFQIRALDTDIRAALAVWPAITSPGLHGALTEMVKSGRVEDIDVKLTMSPEAKARLAAGQGMDDDALSVTLKASQVSFLPNPGLPLLTDARVTGSTTGRTVDLTITQASAELGEGRKLALSEGTFTMSDTWASRPQAQIGFRSTGTAESLVALLNVPSLREFSPLKIEPGALRGNVDLVSKLSLPLVNDLQFADVIIRSTGSLSNLSSDSLLGGEKLEGASLALTYDRGQLALKGEGRVGGEKAPIELKQNAKGQGEASVSLLLDNAALKRRGLGPETGLSGPLQLKITKQLGRSPEAAPRVEVDLTKAAIEAGVPGLSKPAGRPGKASFIYVADEDGPDFEDLTIESAPLLAKGRISLTKQNAFESASFSQLRLSPGDNLTKVEVTRDGTLTKISARGAVLDARPFIRDLFDAPPAPARGARGANSGGGDIDLDLEVPILTGFNSEALGNSQFKLSRRNGAIRTVAYQGRIGRADLTIRQLKQTDSTAPIVVQSENGGAVMRFLDLYRRAYGGDLVLQLGTGDGRQPGELLMRNFTVRDEPALRRVVGSPAPQGANAPDSASVPQQRIDASEVAFTKLRAEFVRSASRIDINDAVLWGQKVGFTVQGNINYGRDRVDIGGTFVPGYAFNNAFAQVPVVGVILGGGQYGGLFAVNFRVSGSASQPTMSVNPLSAIAPGILRRFVDPLGGGPLEQSRPAGKAPGPGTPER